MSTSATDQPEPDRTALEESAAAIDEAHEAAAKVAETRNPADELDMPGPAGTPPGNANPGSGRGDG